MKAKTTGFTLLELLVTVAIMSMLAIAATGGYNAIQRSMNERGVVAAASSVMRSARERAQIDRRHVAVFCYNRLLKKPSDDGTQAGVVAGIIAAVRRYGRLTAVRGNFLYDEFADLDQCYETLANQNVISKRHGMRLYRLNGAVSKMEYSVVADATWYADEDAAERIYLPSLGVTTNAEMAAYYRLDGDSGWKAGDGYGFEFIEMQLPDNYVFDVEIPTELDQKVKAKVIDFSPDGGGKGESAVIRLAVPDASGNPRAGRKLGAANADEDKSV